MIKNTLLIILLTLGLYFFSSAQEIEFPVWTVKSHSNLEIEKISLTDKLTTIDLFVTSDMDEGAWFCADKNIILVSIADSIRLTLIRSENIPVCPEQHKFSSKGEILKFKLYFPPIQKQIKSINLIEDCNEACFYFTDIVLDPVLNKEIRTFEKAVEDYQNRQIDLAIEGFNFIVNSCMDKSSYRYSHSLSILPILHEEKDQLQLAKNYYHKILNSQLIDSTQSDKKDEFYSNFKHKASIRLAMLNEKLGNLETAVVNLNEAVSKYPLQAKKSEVELIKSDHYLIFNNKIRIIQEIDRHNTFLTLVFSEYVNMEYGEIPVNTQRLIEQLLEKNISKEKFTERLNLGLKSIKIVEKDSKTIVIFWIDDYKYEIISNKLISADEVRTNLKQISYYSN